MLPAEFALGFKPVVKGSGGCKVNPRRLENHAFVALGFVVGVARLQGRVEGLGKGL